LWSYATGGGVSSSPAVANGVVYFAANGGNIYGLNASKGNRRWKYFSGYNYIYSSPAVVNGVVYVGSNNGVVYAFGLK
jgi:outer membrane protein assembly factor BamB